MTCFVCSLYSELQVCKHGTIYNNTGERAIRNQVFSKSTHCIVQQGPLTLLERNP